MGQTTPKRASTILIILAAAAIATAMTLPKIRHNPAYHDFADKRSFIGIPNTLDVLSNLPLMVFGLFGIAMCLRTRGQSSKTDSVGLKILFFASVLLTGIGSAYYHCRPDNDSIVWDRIPLSVMFLAILLVVLADRISPATARRLVWPALLVGPFSVLYWRWSELQGAGDLRFYGTVQLLPLVLIPAIMLLQPKGSIKNSDLWKAFSWYAVAKLVEFQDKLIFDWTGWISGHTMKHICAGVAVFYLLRICRHSGNLVPGKHLPNFIPCGSLADIR